MTTEKVFEYSLNEMPRILNFPSYGSFQLIKSIAEGNFSQIFLAKKIESNSDKNSNIFKKYAIKIFKKFRLQNNKEEMTIPKKILFTEICEVYMMKRIKGIRSPYLVEILDWNIDRNTSQMKVLMESMPCDLRDYFCFKANYSLFDENILKIISYQLLSGLNSLHKNRIIHFDIKPENILYDQDKKLIKITDFTFSQYVTYDLNKKCSILGGTYSYMPLEGLFETKKYSFSYDIWSLGIVLLELVCRENPFKGKDKKSVIKNILKFFRLDINLMNDLNCFGQKIFVGLKFEKKIIFDFIKNNKKFDFLDDNFCDLVSQMLCIDPNCRITAEEAVKHTYFNQK